MSTSRSTESQDSQTVQTPSESISLHLYEPHKKQVAFIYSKAKRKIIRAGRRGGKTVGVAIYAVLQFLAKRRILYAAPTSDQLRRFWSEVSVMLGELIAAGAVYVNQSEHIIEYAGTENRIRAKTAWNAETLRGDYADELILDEYQLMDETAWHEVGAPMLVDNNGNAIFIYTPPSYKSNSVTKANDPRHAAKLWDAAKADRSGRWATFHFTSYENPYLSAEGLREVASDLTQATLRREILAEDSREIPGSAWKQEMIDATRVSHDQVPWGELDTVIVGVDPTGSSTNEAGIVAAGRGPAPLNWKPSDEIMKRNPDCMSKKHVYVIRDASMKTPTSRVWAAAAVNLYYDVHADELVAETNYGGDMVASTILQVERGQNVVYRAVSATRGKVVRAAPVVAAYECGIVHHVGVFQELEDEMTSYVPGVTAQSPNRMDAAVWSAIKLVDGAEVMGFIEYLKAAAGGDVHQPEIVSAAAMNNTLVAAAETCSKCNCATVREVNTCMFECAECGHRFSRGMMPDSLPNRNDYLQAQRGTYAERGGYGRFGR